MKSARNWSGTLMSQPTQSDGEKGRIDSIAGSLANLTSPASGPARQAEKQAAKSGRPGRLASRQPTRGIMNSP